MDRFLSLQLFVRVVDCGSLTQAARELGIGQPSVSKQIAALEARLGAQLLNRTSRGLSTTAAGNDLYDSAVSILAELEDAESRIGRGGISPAGLVRIATPPALGRMFIIPRLRTFFTQFSAIQLDFIVAERHVDLVKEGIDVAFRIGALNDSSLVARHIGNMRTCTIATPEYLSRFGTPGHPAQLVSHNLVTGLSHGGVFNWKFKDENGNFVIEPTGNTRSDDSEALRAAVIAGLGIGHGPSAIFAADLRSGRVIRILADYAPDPLPINVVYVSRRKVPQRLRVAIDFLAQVCADEPELRLV